MRLIPKHEHATPMPPQLGIRVCAWPSHIQHGQWNHPTEWKGGRGRRREMPLFCNLSPLLLLFIQYSPLVVGFKAPLPWKCKRLCQHWLGWMWWKWPKDGPSAELPTLCSHFFPGLISQVRTSSSGAALAVYSETITYIWHLCIHHEEGRWRDEMRRLVPACGMEITNEWVCVVTHLPPKIRWSQEHPIYCIWTGYTCTQWPL